MDVDTTIATNITGRGPELSEAKKVELQANMSRSDHRVGSSLGILGFRDLGQDLRKWISERGRSQRGNRSHEVSHDRRG